MEIDFIIKVLHEVEKLEASKGKAPLSLEDLRLWLNEEYYQSQSPEFISKEKHIEVYDLENEIAKQVILLGRFSKQMIRRGLVDFPELANEEFTYLYRLIDEPMLTKMQLIERNAHEKPTGIAIINRLVSAGLLEEVPDGTDRRVTRLKATEQGEQYFRQSVVKMTTVSRILSAKLEASEKEQLLGYLKKLNEFHFTVYQDYRDADIESINALI